MIVDTVLNIINKFIPDQDKQAEIKKALEEAQTQQAAMQKDIILAEMNADSWLTRNWRSMMMISFGIIICSHWLMDEVIPYIKVILSLNIWVPKVKPLDPMYVDLIKSLAGLSIGARTLEKVVTTWKK